MSSAYDGTSFMNRKFLNMIISPKSSKLQLQRDRSRQHQDIFTEKLISCLYSCDSVNYSSSGLEGTQRTLFFPIPFQLCHAAKRHRTAIIFELSGTHRTQPATYEKKAKSRSTIISRSEFTERPVSQHVCCSIQLPRHASKT